MGPGGQAAQRTPRDEQGHPLQFHIYTNANRQYRINIATFIRSNLSRIGIEAEVRPIDSNLLTDKLNSTRDFEAIVLGWQTAAPPDPVLSKNVLMPGADQYYASPKQ